MRIMQIVPSFDVGGAETMCAGLCLELQRMGHSVVAVSLSPAQSKLTRALTQGGVDLRLLNKRLGVDPSCVLMLRGLIRQVRPQVIHTHLHALKYAALAIAGGRPIPIVHTVHNQAREEAVKLDQKIGNYLFRTGKATPVALSREIQASVMELYGLPEERVPVVCNGIDLSACLQKTDYALHYPPRLIHVGRFYPQKNHEIMMEAMALLKSRGITPRLLCYGDGPRLKEIKELTEKMGLGSQVEFPGLCDNVYPKLVHGDLFLLPSKWEGVPMTVIEAMATGLPVVASRVGGIPDMIEDGVDGMLIEPTAESLAQAVETLLKDETLRQRLGQAAASSAQRFSAAAMAQAYAGLYGRRGGRR